MAIYDFTCPSFHDPGIKSKLPFSCCGGDDDYGDAFMMTGEPYAAALLIRHSCVTTDSMHRNGEHLKFTDYTMDLARRDVVNQCDS